MAPTTRSLPLVIIGLTAVRAEATGFLQRGPANSAGPSNSAATSSEEANKSGSFLQLNRNGVLDFLGCTPKARNGKDQKGNEKNLKEKEKTLAGNNYTKEKDQVQEKNGKNLGRKGNLVAKDGMDPKSAAFAAHEQLVTFSDKRTEREQVIIAAGFATTATAAEAACVGGSVAALGTLCGPLVVFASTAAATYYGYGWVKNAAVAQREYRESLIRRPTSYKNNSDSDTDSGDNDNHLK